MKIYLYENVINETYKTYDFNKGCKVKAVIKELGYIEGNYIIIVDAKIYNYPECQDMVLDCDFATIKLCAEGKQNIFNALLVVVGTVLSFTTVGATVGYSLITAGITGFLAQLFAPKTPNSPEYDNQNEQKYGVKGVANQSNLGKCYPVIFGKSIITPPYVGNYYTTLSSNNGDGEQFLTVLLNAGYNELSCQRF